MDTQWDMERRRGESIEYLVGYGGRGEEAGAARVGVWVSRYTHATYFQRKILKKF